MTKHQLIPTWTGVLPLLIWAIKDGTDNGRDAAIAELKEMAKAADLWNASSEPVMKKLGDIPLDWAARQGRPE